MALANSIAEGANAIAAIVSAVTAIALAAIAWFQIGVIARQQSQSATLQACDRYDFDAVLNEERRKLRYYLNSERSLSRIDAEMAYNALFNYFDAIAIGIGQGLYKEEIAREHLGPILRNWVNRIHETSDTVLREERESFSNDFPYIAKLYKSWWPGDRPWFVQQGS